MINVFLNNGHVFEEVSIDAAVAVKILIDTAPEFNGAVVLVCLDRQSREVARFKWADIIGYAVGNVETSR